jgi:hypothetical protein
MEFWLLSNHQKQKNCLGAVPSINVNVIVILLHINGAVCSGACI